MEIIIKEFDGIKEPLDALYLTYKNELLLISASPEEVGRRVTKILKEAMEHKRLEEEISNIPIFAEQVP